MGNKRNGIIDHICEVATQRLQVIADSATYQRTQLNYVKLIHCLIYVLYYHLFLN